MIMWNMYAWHGNYDAMQLIQIKRNKNPGTHIYGSSYFTTRHFNCWLAWQNKTWVSYTILNKVGKPYLVIPKLLHMLLLGYMQTTTRRYDVRCKQAYEWHIQILHIFLINFHIKYFLFWVTVRKIWF
jgi:hypothetical protein